MKRNLWKSLATGIMACLFFIIPSGLNIKLVASLGLAISIFAFMSTILVDNVYEMIKLRREIKK